MNEPSAAMIVQKPKFIDEVVANRYIDYGRTSDTWDKYITHTKWDGRIIHYPDMPREMDDLSCNVLLSVRSVMKAEYQLTEEIYPDDFALVRWRPGDFQGPHADGENPEGGVHPFFWRKYSNIIYLNDAYEGGQLYFPDRKVSLKPEPRTLVFFPGTSDYIHGVNAITAGIRYTLATFWATDPSKSIYPWVFVSAPAQAG